MNKDPEVIYFLFRGALAVLDHGVPRDPTPEEKAEAEAGNLFN